MIKDGVSAFFVVLGERLGCLVNEFEHAKNELLVQRLCIFVNQCFLPHCTQEHLSIDVGLLGLYYELWSFGGDCINWHYGVKSSNVMIQIDEPDQDVSWETSLIEGSITNPVLKTSSIIKERFVLFNSL